MSNASAVHRLGEEVRTWGSLVKFSHTVFALPFALSMLLVVARHQHIAWIQAFWILVALVAARTSSMAFNRYVDRRIDAMNPRTVSRELPAGRVTERSVLLLISCSSVVFLWASAMLGPHCLLLAPAVLAVLMAYSLSKRCTSCSHLVLGLCLAMAPGGVWYALTARFAVLPLVLMGAVLLWVAGFDILYSCQDEEFDRRNALYSIPARLGARRAFVLARFLHACAFAMLVLFGKMAALGAAYYGGTLVFGCLLASQHLIVSPGDLRRIDAAFFTRNGLASIVFFLSVLSDYLLRP